MVINLSKIKEEVFTFAENPDVAKACNPNLSEGEAGRITIHAVYTKFPTIKVISDYAFEGPKQDVVRNFKDELKYYLSKFNPHTLWDCAFLIDLFCPIRPEPRIDTLQNRRFTKNKIVDDILAQSKGVLLWDFQLRSLAGLFYDNFGEGREMVTKIRDGLNSRNPEIEDLCKTLRLDHGFTLYDVFQERALTTFTCEPSIKKANILYDALMDAVWRKLGAP